MAIPFASKNGIAIGVLLLILLMTPITAYLVYQNQNPQSRASVSGGPGTMTLSPAALSLALGETKPVRVMFDTGGKTVTLVQAVLSYNFTGTNPQVTASNVIMDQALRNAGGGSWACTILSVTVVAPKVDVNISCNFSSDGYATTGAEALASFDLTANSTPGSNPFQISFDSANSLMYEKVLPTDPVKDILQTPTSSVSVTVGSGATVTPTVTPTATPAPTTSHKVCINSACAVMAGAGSNECATVGASCTQTFSQVAATECNGKYDPNCYNCVDDNDINVFDFTCFSAAYGKQRTSGVNWQ